ncbi:MAG TPA: hypothetical protein VFR67_19265, partial [Pilimelia sp.]|nr:hypothetical protein [Pilimelia sp.]
MSGIDKASHTRREFLRAVAGTSVVVGLTAAGAGTAAAALAEADVYEVNLLGLGVAPERYTTRWPTGANWTVDVWDAAFRKAISLLNAHGGGRLWIPGNSVPYYLRDHHIFDLPSVSVHLMAGSEVMMVGPKNPAVGTPIGFYGGLGDRIPPRVQRDFAALNGPGRIGYPVAQLEYYERGNAVGFSYIKTVH